MLTISLAADHRANFEGRFVFESTGCLVFERRTIGSEHFAISVACQGELARARANA